MQISLVLWPNQNDMIGFRISLLLISDNVVNDPIWRAIPIKCKNNNLRIYILLSSYAQKCHVLWLGYNLYTLLNLSTLRLMSLICILLKFVSRQLSGNLFKLKDEFAKMETKNIRKFLIHSLNFTVVFSGCRWRYIIKKDNQATFQKWDLKKWKLKILGSS